MNENLIPLDNNLIPLPPDYSPLEYASLAMLEAGDVDIWLRRRGQLLIEKAKDIGRECEAGKLASLVVVGVSAVMSANPLMWIPMGIGAGGYVWTIFTEYQDTGSIKPIPLYRGRLGSLLGILEGRQEEETHPLLEQIAYLPEQDKDEVLLLRYRFGQIAGVLGAVPPRTRFDLYRHIVEQYHARQILIEGDEINAYLAFAVSEARRTMPVQPEKPALPSQPQQPIPSAAEVSQAQERTIGDRVSVKVEPASTVSPTPAPATAKTLPPFDRDRIINESKGLMIIGDMGAAKTCVAQYIANGFLGYGIIIFDPHGKTDWGNAYVITKMGAIYRQMAILLELLENGDETPMLVIADEWLEIRGDRRNKEKGSPYKGLADDFIRLFSTKPRKFNKLAGFVLHSPNVEAAGVDSFLRENYLKVYLGRLAKKEFPQIQDCAYPCVLEDEQQEHPTHGHHAEFKPKGKAPRHLQPLNSAAIAIPLAYMEGGAVKVCTRGWSNGQLNLDIADIRKRLELLVDTGNETGIDTENDTDTCYQEEENEGGTDETNSVESDTGNDTDAKETAETLANTSGSSGIDEVPDPGIDMSADTKRYTPANLTKEQMVTLIQHMQQRLSQTQIIQDLWCVEKNKTGWKQAYAEFKELVGSSND